MLLLELTKWGRCDVIINTYPKPDNQSICGIGPYKQNETSINEKASHLSHGSPVITMCYDVLARYLVRNYCLLKALLFRIQTVTFVQVTDLDNGINHRQFEELQKFAKWPKRNVQVQLALAAVGGKSCSNLWKIVSFVSIVQVKRQSNE